MLFYGKHACLAALGNRQRVVEKIFISDTSLLKEIPPSRQHIPVEKLDKQGFDRLLSSDSVHQGIALRVQRLPSFHIESLSKDSTPNQCVVLLDQISDPRNIGAIIRSAAAFNVKTIILTDRHAPEESPVMAKAASGALEIVPLCYVKNLNQAILYLRDIGFWMVTLAEEGKQPISDLDVTGKIALVLGSEGQGVRHLTKERSDFLVHLPTHERFTTLNVSTAAAISFYEVFKGQSTLDKT